MPWRRRERRAGAWGKSSGFPSSSTQRAAPAGDRLSSAAAAPAELQRRVDAGEIRPDYGPARLHPTAGAVVLGARPLLVAFNLELTAGDLEDAHAVAAAVRESSGGMEGVQALGLQLPRSGKIQVSLNIVDVEKASLAEVVARVRTEAAGVGAVIGAGELVGLLPECQVAEPSALALTSLPDDRILERRLAAESVPPGE